MSRDSRQRLQPDDFTVGWVCAIAEELAAARLLLDARYDDVGYESQGYLYTFGKIGKHNVAIGYLPAGRQGSSSATEVAMDMKAHFKRMRFCLMVGIGGGVPSAHNDIRLGDVVVSQPAGQHGGVVQYDFGKRERGVFRRTGSLNAPPTLLLNALSRVESSRMIGESKFRDYLSAFESHPEFNRAGAGPDILFRAGYEHVGGTDCSGCDQSTIFRRRPPTKEVEVHFGTIASGNQVMKTASVRDKISADLGGVLCFEMEAAGLMNSFQCLVIRGISDYADSHKNDKWKKPAAAAAAAFAKDLLSELSTQEVSGTSTLDEAEWVVSMIESVKLDTFLKALPSRQKDRLESDRPADPGDLALSWIFHNLDFQAWERAESGNLWVSGPPGDNIAQFSSYLRRKEKSKSSATGKTLVLYTCSPDLREKEMSVELMQTFLSTAIATSDPITKLDMIKKFLYNLRGSWLEDRESEKASYANINPINTPTNKEFVKKILCSPAHHQLKALHHALSGHRREILIIIENAHNALGPGTPFLLNLLQMTGALQRDYMGVKLLITSQPRVELTQALANVVNIERDSERQACLRKLHFRNTRYQKITSQYEDSFKWIWNHHNYRRWSQSTQSSLLYLEGKPGSGKSTMTKYVRENLVNVVSDDAIVAHFFYSHREGVVQQSHHSMLRSIIWDVIMQEEMFFYHNVQAEYRKQESNEDAEQWDYDSLQRIVASLKTYCTRRPLYLVIDAVDESTETDRHNILKLFFDLCLKTARCIIKVFIASRPVRFLERMIGRVHHHIILHHETKTDIKQYTSSLLPEFNDADFRHKALEYITSHAQGVFLWVDLVCKELHTYDEEGRANLDMQNYLESLPTELHEFYQHMIRQMSRAEDDLRDTLQLFRFVLFACRSLTIEEVLHTLAINHAEAFDASDQDFVERIPQTRRVILRGGNFLEIKEINHRRFVQIMHQTVQEFFLVHIGHDEDSRAFCLASQDSHRLISITCIRYIMLCLINAAHDGTPTTIAAWTTQHFQQYVEYLETRPLAEYAFAHVKYHINKYRKTGEIKCITSELNGLPRAQHALYLTDHWREEIMRSSPHPKQHQVGPSTQFRAKLFATASEAGLCTAARIMISLKTDINGKDSGGQTPVLRAVINSHEPLVTLLLEHSSLHPDISDGNQRTPLSWASGNGHQAIAKRLLSQKNVNVNSKDSDGRAPLHWAAIQGHGEVVRLLLEQENILVDILDRQRRTPLLWAAKKGHSNLYSLLVNNSNAALTDKYGRSALSWAAGNGYDTVVRQLLDNANAAADQKSNIGRTPLSYAAENGHHTIVNDFMSRCYIDVDVNSRDKTGRTPLSWAAQNGHRSVVSLLISHNKVDDSLVDFDLRPPLSWAAEHGHSAVVDILMGCAQVDIHQKDGVGFTALQWAQEKGHEDVARLLASSPTRRLRSGSCSTIPPLLIEMRGQQQRVVSDEEDAQSNDQGDTTLPRSTRVDGHVHAPGKRVAGEPQLRVEGNKPTHARRPPDRFSSWLRQKTRQALAKLRDGTE